MPATDEQIERLRILESESYWQGSKTSIALTAVLEELTTLRKLRDAVQAYGSSGSENEQAATFDAMFAALAKCK